MTQTGLIQTGLIQTGLIQTGSIRAEQISAAAIAGAVARYRPHALHTDERHWPQTNCYVDLWIELLHAAGCDPLAGLGVTVAQDFEGDQFTFTKYHPEDLRVLYGLAVQELSLYEDLQTHVLGQVAQGRMMLVEVDGFHLPDTRGLTYRQEHGKTTIGIRLIDPEAGALGYFHNSGFYALDGADYAGIFAPRPDQPAMLPPYAEFIAPRTAPLRDEALRRTALARFQVHLARRPGRNPVRAYRAVFPGHLERLLAAPPPFFHQYAFNVARQLGFNWELLGDVLRWLDPSPPEQAVRACARIAENAKALQFRMARLVARRRSDPCTELLDALEQAYDTVMAALVTRYG